MSLFLIIFHSLSGIARLIHFSRNRFRNKKGRLMSIDVSTDERRRMEELHMVPPCTLWVCIYILRKGGTT